MVATAAEQEGLFPRFPPHRIGLTRLGQALEVPVDRGQPHPVQPAVELLGGDRGGAASERVHDGLPLFGPAHG